MSFPRTQIENLSVPRMLIGTNWFTGYSHTSAAKDKFICKVQNRKNLADIIETFMRAGVDAIYGVGPGASPLNEAVADAEDRVGSKCIRIGTPHLDLSGTAEAHAANEKTFDDFAAIGCDVCLPHMCITDAMVDRKTESIPGMDEFCAMIRQRGMIPGLSTHMPETVIYADKSDLDVGTYVQIYNAAGFLMQLEVDWVHRIIHEAKKPVITIKPLAAGRLLPLVGLAFNWATLRDRDMICIGCLTADEAQEVIDISLSQLSRQGPAVELQSTRSKKSVTR